MPEKSRNNFYAHETVLRPSLYICGGRFLFVHKGLRLPLQQIGKCSAAFYFSGWRKIARRNAPVLNSARIFVSLFPHQNSLIHTNELAEFSVFLFRACLNFALPQFENCFRGCFSAFTRMIAGYLTSKNGETDRKQTQKGADKIFNRKI